ncbi:MAG: hypothetical protein LBI06_00090 [Treponema sp.]|jgi:cell division protein FtsL|nr:hypothetical protein [Treponema sp.]
MTRYYAVFFLAVLSVPFLLGISAWQSIECGKIRGEIKNIEKIQEAYVSENKALSSEIVGLLATERLETEAQKMGMRKMRPEDVILIIMGGRGRDL